MIMNCARGEGAFKLLLTSHVPKGDNRVGDRGSDIRSHDDRDREIQRQGAGSNQADGQRGRKRRTLDQAGREDQQQPPTDDKPAAPAVAFPSDGLNAIR